MIKLRKKFIVTILKILKNWKEYSEVNGYRNGFRREMGNVNISQMGIQDGAFDFTVNFMKSA